MFALTLGQAKTVAMLVVAVLVVGAVASAWLMKTVMQKVALVLILGLLAALVWTQRTALDDCADTVELRVRATGADGDSSCSFFGRDIEISTARS